MKCGGLNFANMASFKLGNFLGIVVHNLQLTLLRF